MKHKSYLDNVERKTMVQPSPGKRRLHMCERTEDFNKIIFDSFIKSISQADIINYNDTSILKKRLADFHGVEPENIFLGSGSDQVLSTIFNVFVEKDSYVIMPEARFPMYDVYAQQNQAQIFDLRYDRNDQLLTYVPPHILNKTSLYVIGNPNSPVGDVLTLDQIEKIALSGIPLVLDQAYGDFGNTYVPTAFVNSGVIFVNSFSKSWGAAGLRIGYAIASKETVTILNKLRQMFEVSSLSQKFALTLLDNIGLCKQYFNEIIIERTELQRLPDVISNYGNWIHLPQEKYLKLCLANNWEVKVDVTLPNREGKLIRMSIFKGLHKLLKAV